MTTYTAPVEDMMFLYEKLRNNKKYNEIDKYKDVTPDLEEGLLDELLENVKERQRKHKGGSLGF